MDTGIDVGLGVSVARDVGVADGERVGVEVAIGTPATVLVPVAVGWRVSSSATVGGNEVGVAVGSSPPATGLGLFEATVVAGPLLPTSAPSPDAVSRPSISNKTTTEITPTRIAPQATSTRRAT